ncbi:reverse transcriptase [Phytophthora megakarya]|uniref:Reverse transcriptase n=1 Tax=Phytophthora megakarya TaxID=4795 RepID=A0A225UR84_9STRA|nr:reverse transcriptase [Phytophthora megakarya]
MATQELRQDFAKDEAKCVEQILKGTCAETAAEEHPDVCPIGRDELHRHFTGTNSAPAPFHYDAPQGHEFWAALDTLPGPTEDADAFTDELTQDEVEDQLSHVAKTSSPRHDGVGYDIYRRFAPQLIPLLHAAYRFCWLHRRLPALWKPTIYKLYSGLLARRLSHWMERNQRLPMAQKGFRAFNGCHEHNLVATTLLGQTRRLHRRLYQV